MEWFIENFVKVAQLKNGKRGQTLLLPDNAPTDPSCDILQPMDQRVIKIFNRFYKKKLLRKLLLEKRKRKKKKA